MKILMFTVFHDRDKEIGAARETLTSSPVQPWMDLAGSGGSSHLCLSHCWWPSLPVKDPLGVLFVNTQVCPILRVP